MPLDGATLFSLVDNSLNVDIFGEKAIHWLCESFIGFASSADVPFSALSLISITDGKQAENMYLECWR